MAENKRNAGTVSIPVKITLQPSSSGEKAPQSVVYAYSGNNAQYLAKSAVEEGSAVLEIRSAASAREVRVVVGPYVAGEKPPALSDLTRRGASEQIVRVDPGAKVEAVNFKIPPAIWICWIRFCFVQGTLLKSVITGGLPVDLPVCGAQVQIWEVEPIEIIWPKLPISVIDKLRQIIITPERASSILPVNPNPPDPAPFANLAAFSTRVTLAKPTPTVTAPPTASPDFASLQILAQTSSGEAFRQALVPYIPIIRPWLCELIPLFVTKTLVATLTTDRCGHFEDIIFLSCFSPNPNLYFTATVNFFLFSVQIYGPTPVACYTYWNYQCGTDVTLYTDNCFAPGCSPCAPVNAAENYVLFRAIGGIPLSSIYGDSPLLPSTPQGQAAGGVLSGLNSPFGGLLLPRVEFDSSLLDNNLAAYYQISYWDTVQLKWIALTGDIYRHYNEFIGTQLVTTPYLLGPQTVGAVANLFAIPPALPPVGDWAFPDPAYDLANAQFPTTAITTAMAGGTYGLAQLKLDLYDAAGNPVNIAAAGITYYVPGATQPDGTIDTVGASALGLVSGNSMIVYVYVDNRPTQAQLPQVSTPVNSTASDPCGILNFNSLGDNVDIEYVAYQPGNFLYWDLDVVRGVSGSVASTGGQSNAGSPGSPVDFNNLVSLLMGGCPQAAFGVNLDVYTLCTDGWSQLTQYDSSASIAFALTKPCPDRAPKPQ
jgi:hypothetical protein